MLVWAFTNAASKDVIRIVRRDMNPLDYTIATTGFAQAMKAFNSFRSRHETGATPFGVAPVCSLEVRG